MHTLISIVCLLIFSPNIHASDIKDAWGGRTVLGNRILFVTHPSSEYDSRKVAESAMRREISEAQDKNIPVILLIDNITDFSNFYLNDLQLPLLYYSETGGHNFKFGEEVTFRFTGGHFNYCGCRTVRDIILRMNRQNPETPINIELVRDGIYFFPEDTEAQGWPERYSLDGNSDGISESLASTEFFDTPIRLARAIENEYFSTRRGRIKGEETEKMCNWMDWEDRYEYVRKNNFHFRVLSSDGQVIREFGDPKKQQVNFILL